MARNIVIIALPLPSIVYAPLYVAIDRINRSNHNYKFWVKCQRGPILVAKHQTKRRAFAPSYIDPVFSPVIDTEYFENNPRCWFAVGDPLRVRRLAENERANNLSYRFLGTLVDQLAFWVVGEKRSFGRDQGRYNYVSCHMRGMTGYYLAERIFNVSNSYSPLAPAMPGTEVRHYFKMVEIDWQRKKSAGDDGEDPIHFAAITTEVGELIHNVQRLSKERVFKHGRVSELFEGKIQNDDFIMTALIARVNNKNADEESKIRRASELLVENILNSLATLRQDPHAFGQELVNFYLEHRATFGSPTDPNDGNAYIDLVLRELKGVYRNSENLLASESARSNTDKLLRMWLRSDLMQVSARGREDSVEKEFNQICTDTWQGAEGNLW